LLNPPTVEGWHTGHEWIDSGALVERINFASSQVGDTSKPGVKKIVDRLKALGAEASDGEIVDNTLELVGPLQVTEARKLDLIRYLEHYRNTYGEEGDFNEKIAGLLQLVVASREYQFA
jgi:hypothetical protein